MGICQVSGFGQCTAALCPATAGLVHTYSRGLVCSAGDQEVAGKVASLQVAL